MSILQTNKIIDNTKVGVYTKGVFSIDVQSIEKEGDNTIVVFAKASKNGKPCGFGFDGSVEIERFRFVNPPILVPDGTFTIKNYIDPLTGEEIQCKELGVKEDPAEALRQILVDTIRQVAKDNHNIKIGKRGNTTTTVFASYNAMILFTNGGSDGSWSTYHDAATGTSVDTTDQRWAARIDEGTAAGSFAMLSRTGFTFDTSSLGTDTINSATMSIHGDSTTNNNNSSFSVSINIFGFTPASSASYATSDYSAFGSTQFSTSIAFSSWSTSAYNDFALNASGIATINKTGNTTIGSRESIYDGPNVAPSGSGGRPINRFGYNSYLASGTTLDPKLVIVHTVFVPNTTNFFLFA